MAQAAKITSGKYQAMSIPGYCIPAVEEWIRVNVSDLRPPFSWTKLEGGHSNLTYRLEDSLGAKAVIRRPPEGKLLPKAHDVAREWRLIGALHSTDVPVPEPLGFCDDHEVTGAVFFIMGMVDGLPLYSSDDTIKHIPLDRRSTAAASYIEALALLHLVNPDKVGLGDLAKKEGYVERQIKTWYRSWTESVAESGIDDRRMHEIREFLLANLPEQGPARIVHGDFGFHNLLMNSDGEVAAIVDWEISTLGDPLADLAYALNWWPDPLEPDPLPAGAATSVPGFPAKSALADQYAEMTGSDLSKLDLYVGFNRWKSAAITQGVYARYMSGKKSSEGVDLDGVLARTERSINLAEYSINKFSS